MDYEPVRVHSFKERESIYKSIVLIQRINQVFETMKKLFFMAFVASSMVFASCGFKMSPEATSAWNDFKEKAAAVSTDEAVEKFESLEAYEAAFDAAMNAGTAFGKDFDGKVTQEVADSFAAMTRTMIEMDKKIKASMEEELAEEEEVEGEEVEE